MKYLKITLLAILMVPSLMPAAQITQWATVQIGDLQCDFPKGYGKIEASDASGVYYEGAKVYLTVTSLPDTSSMKGHLDRDFTWDFMKVVESASRRLYGYVREFRDTVIANQPGYISKIEVAPKDGPRSYYELLQVLHQDSIRGFSCQYYKDDPEAYEICRKFFQSVQYAPRAKTSGVSSGYKRYWIGGLAVILILGIGLWIFRKFRA
jgi:hypothetical protein